MTADSYLDYAKPAASGSELGLLQQLAELQAAAEAEIADLEAKLNKAREKYKDLAERQVPELMDQIGMEEFRTNTGLRIVVQETIRASIPKAKAPLAFGWLKDHGHAAMIKRVVSVQFGKGEDDRAEALLSSLSGEYAAEEKSSVHPSTLAAFIREKLSNGDEVPLDLFGVHRQRVTKISTK